MQVESTVLASLFEILSLVQNEAIIIALAALIYIIAVQNRVSKQVRCCKSESLCAKEIEIADPVTPTRAKKTVVTPEHDVHRFAGKIRSCAQDGDFKGVTAAFATGSSCAAPSNSLLHNCFLDACVQCGKIDHAIDHFDVMKKLGIVDQVGFNTILKAHLFSGRTAAARGVIKEMVSLGIKANCITYGELLDATVSSKNHNEMWGLVSEMRGVGIKMNSVICSILLKSLSAQSQPWEVKKILSFIDEVEDPIDEVLFCSAIDACIRGQQLEQLASFLSRYNHKCVTMKLSTPSFGIIMKAYGKLGDVAKAEHFWHNMEERGVTPNALTLGCLIEALVSNGQQMRAWEFVKQQVAIPDRREFVNTVIYSTVLKGFVATQNIDQVFAVYEEMRRNNVDCNTITLNLILHACAKCCVMDRVAALLEDVKRQHVELDIISFSTILKGYCQVGDLDRAFQIFQDMKNQKDFAPDEILYNSLLDGCVKQHRVTEALQLLDDMKASRIRPSNFTVCILVKLLGQEKRLNDAFQMMDSLSHEFGIRLNIQVYTSILQACIHSRRLDRALALHDRVAQDVHCSIDGRFYAALVRGCMIMHDAKKAADVVRAAFQLPGGSLQMPAYRKPVGVDAQTLEQLASRLQTGKMADRQVLSSLSADLLEQRGIRL